MALYATRGSGQPCPMSFRRFGNPNNPAYSICVHMCARFGIILPSFFFFFRLWMQILSLFIFILQKTSALHHKHSKNLCGRQMLQVLSIFPALYKTSLDSRRFHWLGPEISANRMVINLGCQCAAILVTKAVHICGAGHKALLRQHRRAV